MIARYDVIRTLLADCTFTLYMLKLARREEWRYFDTAALPRSFYN